MIFHYFSMWMAVDGIDCMQLKIRECSPVKALCYNFLKKNLVPEAFNIFLLQFSFNNLFENNPENLYMPIVARTSFQEICFFFEN